MQEESHSTDGHVMLMVVYCGGRECLTQSWNAKMNVATAEGSRSLFYKKYFLLLIQVHTALTFMLRIHFGIAKIVFDQWSPITVGECFIT